MSVDPDPAAVVTGRPPARWRRVAPAAGLLVLAPWTAECSWGGFAVTDFPLVVIFLAPMYGGAAVLIRETVRRTGAGWPAVVLLATAFGVVQAGLVDQSLFNPAFLADTEYADTQASADSTHVPVLGISAQQASVYLVNHIALSICAPIALVESMMSPARRRAPWLGRIGLVVVGALYLLGSLLIFSDESGRKGFLASPLQLTTAAVLPLVLVGAALLPRWRQAPQRSVARSPHPALPGLLVFVGFLAVNSVPGWAGVAVLAAVAILVGTLVVRWSRRAGWGQRHVLATVAGALLAVAAMAYAAPPYAAASPGMALASDVLASVIILVLLSTAWTRIRRQEAPGHRRAAAPTGHPTSPPA
ncbi:hypothetical protein [Micromonospora mirobrigensis]|uniref:Uncharacterized protein n=1 Tax=Micromonospora mirobrigensis TaxID=262898 RepID=A0A1C4V9G7_9ACTN|nr:hypothetical protein [Micromonospora mirobrigensis]SCE80409.1 hypothetical protein GA0070564_1011043 [Micromonospora mirobrigensis]